MKTPKRVCQAVLLKCLTSTAEQVKVRQTLSIVGDSFDIPNGLLDVEISYVLSTLFRQLVMLMRDDSFCFVNKKKTIQWHQLPPTKDALQKHLQ